jgi:hypothetical protein
MNRKEVEISVARLPAEAHLLETLAVEEADQRLRTMLPGLMDLRLET